jgi:hypothetical protein
MAAGSDGPKLAMTAELWNKVRALFHAALEQPPPERDEFLRRQCGEDSRLYAEQSSAFIESTQDGNGNHFYFQSGATPATRL